MANILTGLDAIVIFSDHNERVKGEEGVDDKVQLTTGARNRVDRGFKLYQENANPYIIVTGADASPDSTRKSGTVGEAHAVTMARYLIDERSVPEEKIIVENQSYDTIAQVLYAAKLLEMIGYNTSNKVALTSVDCHMPRIEEITKRTIEGRFNISYDSGGPLGSADERTEEISRLARFKEDFGNNLEPGKSPGHYIDLLFERHGYYVKKPEFRPEFNAVLYASDMDIFK